MRRDNEVEKVRRGLGACIIFALLGVIAIGVSTMGCAAEPHRETRTIIVDLYTSKYLLHRECERMTRRKAPPGVYNLGCAQVQRADKGQCRMKLPAAREWEDKTWQRTWGHELAHCLGKLHDQTFVID